VTAGPGSSGASRRGYLGLGSNLGDRLAHLQLAVDGLVSTSGLAVVAVSPVYETTPVGGPPQPAYLNAVVAVDTTRSPRQLLEVAQQLESKAGRVRHERWGPRTLDVDVLLVDGERSDEPDLIVPHPRMTERAFVLVPLADLAPEWAERIGPDRAEVRPTGLALTLPE
jgi:2-amino-4-hydroxy-6-hydroxymethyldihydropteridine diphosphokinase